MDLSSAMSYIEEKSKLGITPGLDNIKELLKRLGNPQDSCRCLHIGGTNGKGSIFAFLQDILMKQGMTVGRYISPALITYLERYQINKNYMTDNELAYYVGLVKAEIDNMQADGFKSPSAFEIETAIAFLYFKEKKVDVALIECGMGGALDATNVINKPVASVFSSISLDHMLFLGDTVEAIADNKSRIIKADSICVSYPQEDVVTAVLKKRCSKVNSRYVEISENDIEIINQDINGSSFTYKGDYYEINMLGEFQIKNACTAIEVADAVYHIKHDVIASGIKDTVWVGRFQKVNNSPLTIVDGAHNEKAWLELKAAVNKYFTNKRVIYIIGVLKDKEYSKLVDILKNTMSYAVAITPNSVRALDKEVLAELLIKEGVPCVTANNPEEAVMLAYERAQSQDIVLICGSLSFLGEYINYRYVSL